MKAYGLIYDNELAGYRIDTNTGLGVVDIGLESADKYDINPDVISSLQLYNNHGSFETQEEHRRGKVKDISLDDWICSSLALLINKDVALEKCIRVYTGDSLEKYLSLTDDSKGTYADEILNGFRNRNCLTLLFGEDENARTAVMKQTANRLLQRGITLSRVAFCSIEDGASFKVVSGLLRSLYNHFKMKYIFADNFTNAKYRLFKGARPEMDLDWFMDSGFCSAKYIFSGADKHYFDEYIFNRRTSYVVNVVNMR